MSAVEEYYGGRLRFDPEMHRYFLDDVEVDSVTQVLSACKLVDYSFIPEKDRQFYLDRGKAVHAGCHILDTAELEWSELDPRVTPHVEAWQKFKEDHKVTVIKSERPVFNDVYGFAGTMDKIAEWDGVMCQIELKTNSLPWWVGLQTAGYDACLSTSIPRWGLALKANGNYGTPTAFTDYSDRDNFMAALRVRQMQKLHAR